MTASRNPLILKTNQNLPLSSAQVDQNFLNCLRWAGQWSSGDTYVANQVVLYRGGVLVANKTTSEPAEVGNADWDFIAWLPNDAMLFGTPTNFSPGGGFTAVTGWPESVASGVFVDTPPDTGSGIITVPIASEITITPRLVWTQGNDNKELAYLLWLRTSGTGDTVIDVFDVATDKTTWRAAGSPFSFQAQAGETFQLGMSWNGDSSPGTSSFQACTFEIKIDVPVQFQ